MGLEPDPLQLEHIATNHSRSHQCTHQMQTKFRGFPEKVCIIDKNYFYTHCVITAKSHLKPIEILPKPNINPI